MFAATRNPLSLYQNIAVESNVPEAHPHQLVLMLYEGALLALSDAKQYMLRHETADKGRALSKAIMIIDNGLKASLDVQAGGELGERLAALYDYMADRLLHANLHNRPEILDEVRQLLMELRNTWAQIAPVATAVPLPPLMASVYAAPAPSATIRVGA